MQLVRLCSTSCACGSTQAAQANATPHGQWEKRRPPWGKMIQWEISAQHHHSLGTVDPTAPICGDFIWHTNLSFCQWLK
jgi:hypothetical protein